MKHDHHDCTHSIKYCKHCDTVYCLNCSKEWTVNAINNLRWTYYNSYPETSPAFKVTTGNHQTASTRGEFKHSH